MSSFWRKYIIIIYFYQKTRFKTIFFLSIFRFWSWQVMPPRIWRWSVSLPAIYNWPSEETKNWTHLLRPPLLEAVWSLTFTNPSSARRVKAPRNNRLFLSVKKIRENNARTSKKNLLSKSKTNFFFGTALEIFFFYLEYYYNSAYLLYIKPHCTTTRHLNSIYI